MWSLLIYFVHFLQDILLIYLYFVNAFGMELAELIEKSRVDNVYLRKGPRPQQAGSLALIGHHLIFSTSPKPGEKPSHDDELWVSFAFIGLI